MATRPPSSAPTSRPAPFTSCPVNGDTVASVTLTSTGAAATAAVQAGGYPIVPSAAVGTGLGNYSISYVNGTLTVTARGLTITANDRSKQYGDTATFLGTDFSTGAGQLVNGDTVASVTLTSTGAAATAAVQAGGYPIVPSAAVGTGLGNYSISYVNGTLTVTARGLTITANDRSKQYGDTATFLGTDFSTGAARLVNGDTVASVTLT